MNLFSTKHGVPLLSCLRLASLLKCLAVTVVILSSWILPATEQNQTGEGSRREAAIAEFTRKMKEANYPTLFEKAAAEFNVPADILKGVAFAETRWEHLTWPPGETASPETGMPRPYGIMSLWGNDFFGHSLIEAARLIGKDPDDLKKDPLDNMRGAAALLRKLYDENPKPEGTTEQDIESWRYAIVRFCGIPELDLSHQHALKVYEFMNKGYHQYGIEWDAHPVNLGPMRGEVARIKAEEAKKMEARTKIEAQSSSNAPIRSNANSPSPPPTAERPAAPPPAQAATAVPAEASSTDSSGNKFWIIVASAVLLLGGFLIYRRQAKASK